MSFSLRSGEHSGTKDDPLQWPKTKAGAPGAAAGKAESKGALKSTESTVGPLKRTFMGRSAKAEREPRYRVHLSEDSKEFKEFSDTAQTATKYI